jgi:hypothetical protein
VLRYAQTSVGQSLGDLERFLVLGRDRRLEQVERGKWSPLLIERDERRRLVARARVAGDDARQMRNVAAQLCRRGPMLAVDDQQQTIRPPRNRERLAKAPIPKHGDAADERLARSVSISR